MSLVTKTLIPILIVLMGTAIAIGWYTEHVLTNALLDEQFLEMEDVVGDAARATGLARAIQNPADPESEALFAEFLTRVKDPKTARITIWSPDRYIVFSDLASIVGARASSQATVDAVVETGKSRSIRKTRDDGVPAQSNVGAFLDIYLPIQDGAKVVGVAEVHVVSGAILQPLTRAVRDGALFVVVSLLLVSIGIFFFFRVFIQTPLARAGALARAISAGDFSDQRIPARKDEIGELVGNLDRMRMRLSTLVGNLEAEVQKRTHELKEEETRLSASLGSLTLGIAIFNREREIIYSNAALKSIVRGVHPITFPAIVEEFAGTLDFKTILDASIQKRGTFSIPGIPHGPRFIRLFCAPVVMESKEESLGAVLLLEDVTESKTLERAKDDFLSIASHELRTPLTVIRANAALIRDELSKKGESETAEMADDIHTASIRLIKIVHDFLEIAALERGVPIVMKDDVNLRRMALEVVKELSPIAAEKSVELSLSNGADVPSIRADADRMKQVITNLVGNALRYTTHGSITVSLSEEGNDIAIRVADTGSGIAPEYQSLLFKKFQQADANVMTREHSEGTGLGLYITKLILESMGGTVALESSVVGKGSIFRATMPMRL